MKTSLRWTVTVGLLAALVLVVDVESVLATLARADLRLLGLALLVAAGDRVLMIGKWIPLARVLAPSIEVVPAAKAYLGASFASLFLPSSVGGDAVRAYALGRHDGQVTEVAVSIVMERVLGMVGLSLVAAVVLLLAIGSVPEARGFLPWALGAAVVAVLVLVTSVATDGDRDSHPAREPRSWWGELRALWDRVVTGYRRYADHPRLVATVGVLSTLEQLFPIVVIWILARALDVPAGLFAIAVATPIAMFLMRLPVAIDGIGLVEGALVYFLGLFGVAADQALAIAVANRAVTTLVILPGAVFISNLPGRGGSSGTQGEKQAAPPGETAADSPARADGAGCG